MVVGLVGEGCGVGFVEVSTRIVTFVVFLPSCGAFLCIGDSNGKALII